METPSSVKIVKHCIHMSKKYEESGNVKASRREKSQQKPLIDITNDSPIVGLAKESMLGTPLTQISSKQQKGRHATPGSGETLLRGQVKSLLLKVEEEGEKKISVPPFMRISQHMFIESSSPLGLLLAPTPANTPQVYTLEEPNDIVSVTGQVQEEAIESEPESESVIGDKSISRSLLLDFSEKSENSCVDGNAADVDALCEEFCKINVHEMCRGKHNRFVYDSDDEELIGAVEVNDASDTSSALKLKGLPTPTGKHTRFSPDDEEDK